MATPNAELLAQVADRFGDWSLAMKIREEPEAQAFRQALEEVPDQAIIREISRRGLADTFLSYHPTTALYQELGRRLDQLER